MFLPMVVRVLRYGVGRIQAMETSCCIQPGRRAAVAAVMQALFVRESGARDGVVQRNTGPGQTWSPRRLAQGLLAWQQDRARHGRSSQFVGTERTRAETDDQHWPAKGARLVNRIAARPHREFHGLIGTRRAPRPALSPGVRGRGWGEGHLGT